MKKLSGHEKTQVFLYSGARRWWCDTHSNGTCGALLFFAVGSRQNYVFLILPGGSNFGNAWINWLWKTECLGKFRQKSQIICEEECMSPVATSRLICL